MAFLDNPQDKFKAVHIAGTSGKTSTVYYMTALLAAAGCKVGSTVSPHVDEINERVQINGDPLPEAEFCAALEKFLDIIAGSPVQPSWYEAVIAFAYWYFAKQKVDYAVVEVGLGGLKDGSNIITRSDKICVITDIGFDHMHILGRTLPEIAAQKAGIIKTGNTVFSYGQSKPVMRVIEDEANKQTGKLIVIKEEGENNTALADYQFRNWNLAYEVFLYIVKRDGVRELDATALRSSQALQVPGRMDVVSAGDKTLVMDGAHNAQKMEMFTKSFKKIYPGVKPAVLIGLKKNKDPVEIAQVIKPFAGRIIATSFSSKQDEPATSMPADDLAKAFGADNLPVSAVSNSSDALALLLAAPEKICVVTGSFYLLSEIRKSKLLL